MIIPFLIANWRALTVISAVMGLFGLGFYEGDKHVRSEWKASIEKEQAAANVRSQNLEIELAKQREENKITNSQLEKAIAKNSIYHSCKLPDDGVRALRDATR